LHQLNHLIYQRSPLCRKLFVVFSTRIKNPAFYAACILLFSDSKSILNQPCAISDLDFGGLGAASLSQPGRWLLLRIRSLFSPSNCYLYRLPWCCAAKSGAVGHTFAAEEA